MAANMTKNMARNPYIWKHIRFLGKISMSWDKPIVYRFTIYSRLKEIFCQKKLAFVSPEKWKDPFEKRYLDAEATENGALVELPRIACLCFKMSMNDNSAAFWDAPSKADDFMVRISFDLFHLCSALEKFAENTKSRIYICAANYDYSVDGIKKAHRKKSIMNSSLEESYVRLMCLKRKAYKYEDELRIFVVWDQTNEHKIFRKYEEKGLIYVQCNPKHVIKTIMLESELYSKEHVAIDLGLYNKLTKKEFQEKEKKLIEKIRPVTIVHSTFRNERIKQKISFPLKEKNNKEDLL